MCEVLSFFFVFASFEFITSNRFIPSTLEGPLGIEKLD